MTVTQTFDIPKTMKALQVTGKGVIKLNEVPVKEPGYGEILIKIIKSGVCHTDLHVYNMDFDAVVAPLPLIPGHEGTGYVVKLGPGVTSLKIGDRVGCAWMHNSCQVCDLCLNGFENTCPKQQQTGLFSDGCYAEYTVALESYVGRIPEGISFSQAAPLMCAGVTAYSALKKCNISAGQWVAIFGAGGGLGHLAVQYGKAMGYNVIGVDYGSSKAEYVKTLGAKAFLDTSGAALGISPEVEAAGGTIMPIIGKLTEISGGMGVHACVVFAPVAMVYVQALYAVRPNGTVVGCALPKDKAPVDLLAFVMGGKKLVGSIVGSRTELQEALTLASSAGITSTIEEDVMENISEIYKKMEERKINGRIVLNIAKE